MWRLGDKKQKDLEKREGALGSHKLSKKRHDKTALTQQASDAATSQLQGSSVMVTPATHQPRNNSQIPPSISANERTLPANSPLVMVSPYRVNEEDLLPPLPFSKDLLIRMNHNKQHVEIDLFRPESERGAFPLQDLSPLCLYRDLRTLKITGMMQSYQSYVWLVVWLNPQLTDLTLEMAGEAEPLDMKTIAEAQKYAMCKPTMRGVAEGHEGARHFVRLDTDKVILAVRDLDKGEAAKKSIEDTTNRNGVVESWQLDGSIEAFVKRAEGLKRLDAVVENARLFTMDYAEIEGNEITIAVNFIGTFLLALMILPKLRETAQNLNLAAHYTLYNVSKLLEIYYVRELAERTRTRGSLDVIINMINHGFCHSELTREIRSVAAAGKLFLARTTEHGSRALVHASQAGVETHGQ
ncbi:MAG: hypothetical protein ASARMPRED_005369 [Alectoria sarmentosa]|nr:MAG: hypothetical protein ASARMPRED_005369 [Alectoria sarmentosa]